jgi:hypothetical protein
MLVAKCIQAVQKHHQQTNPGGITDRKIRLERHKRPAKETKKFKKYKRELYQYQVR